MIIPVVAGAILGLAFDMNSVKPGSKYIFDPPDIEKNMQTIPRTFTQSQYRLIESSSDTSSFLDIDGELSLKVKRGLVDISGSGKYMANTVNRQKTVEMLITVNHETETLTFPSYTTLRTDWQGKPPSSIGTHYIRSITYGGQLIISYKLIATKSEHTEEIKAAVTAALGISGNLDANVTGSMEKISKELKGKFSLSITAFATTGPFSPPANMEDCLKLCKEYPGMVKKINNGRGAPLKIELVDVSTLNPDYTAYFKNYAMNGLLNDAVNKFDDLRIALKEFRDWEDRSPIWDEQRQKWINVYQKALKEANLAMSQAISDLDASGGLDQFDEAFKKYGENEENIPHRYMLELIKLKHKCENKPFIWFPYTAAVSHYVHWGSVNCSLPSPEPLFVGYAATSSTGFGNGGNIECLTSGKPELEQKDLGSTVVSTINGLKYQLPDERSGQALCAMCKLENATTAITIAGREECPEEQKLEYVGYLMTSRDAGTGSSLVCFDRYPDDSIPSKQAADSTASLTPVWMICDDCDEDENKKFVSCVVCSR